jgi:hypothetical protein
MKDFELLNLRKSRVIKYNSPLGFLNFVEEIIGDSNNIPLIFGSEQIDEWKIIRAKPQTLSDRHTVENFLEGIREVENKYGKMPTSKDFRSHILIDSQTPGYPQYDIPLISIWLGNQGSNNYGLHILGPTEITRNRIINEGGYTAKTSVDIPTFNKTMDPYIGPF